MINYNKYLIFTSEIWNLEKSYNLFREKTIFSTVQVEGGSRALPVGPPVGRSFVSRQGYGCLFRSDCPRSRQSLKEGNER